MKDYVLSLTEEEAQLFKFFREHQQRIEYLQSQGFFSEKNASVTIHFGQDGYISTYIVQNTRRPSINI